MDRNDDRAIDEAEFIKFFSSGKAAAAAFKLGAKQRGRAGAGRGTLFLFLFPIDSFHIGTCNN